MEIDVKVFLLGFNFNRVQGRAVKELEMLRDAIVARRVASIEATHPLCLFAAREFKRLAPRAILAAHTHMRAVPDRPRRNRLK
jgi:hypothetical protein